MNPIIHLQKYSMIYHYYKYDMLNKFKIIKETEEQINRPFYYLMSLI